jgi:hypothetical protein
MQHMRRFTLLALAICCGAALAQEADRSTPQGAAKAFYAAVDQADRAAIRAAMLTENEQQEKLADAFADVIVAGRKLAQAARAEFGEAGEALGQGMVDRGDIERIDDAAVKVQGDTATIEVVNSLMPLKLRRVEGVWKLVVMDYAGASPQNLPKQIVLLQNIASALDEAAEEIASDKYSTAADAEAAITAKLNNVMIKALEPTTAPVR